MKREIVVCDRCGAEAEGKEAIEALGLGRIVLGFDAMYTQYSGTTVYGGHRTWDKEWCMKCRKELGVVKDDVRKANNGDAPVPTLEDLVREITRQEISSAGREG